MFRHLIPVLADRYHVIAPDHVGFGQSAMPALCALPPEITRWQYVNGVADPGLVSPDSWVHDQALLDRPGNDEIQLKLFRDYPTNVDLYPRVHEYFRDSQVPLLAAWGGQATRSSAPRARRRSARTSPMPRST